MSFTNELANFNASVEVTELLMKTLENAARKLAARCISEAASRHGFDADAEIQALGLENLSVTRKQMAKKTVAEKKEKKPREPKKSVFPMPFFAENVNADGCQGLAYNRGLFTQCLKNRTETGDYCKGCQTEADKNASGCPDCGNVSARLATGLYEFKDPKGRSPISYVKLIKKLNLTLEQVSEETGKTGKTIPEEHLVVVEKKFTRGRPKKVSAVETDDLSVVSDLFSKISIEKKQEDKEVLEEDLVLEEEEVEEEVLESPVKTKKPKLSEDEKAALEAEKAEKKAALEAEKAEKKAALEAEKAALEAEKAEKEAKKLALEAEKAEKKAALEAEKAAKKLALEAEKAAKKLALEAEKEAKKLALEAEKAAKKLALEAEKGQKKEKKVDEKEKKVDEKVDEKATEKVDEPQPAKVKVTRIQISGKSYLKTSNNLLYNPETKEEVGIWDPDTKTIKPLPEEEDEEEQEEDYDSN
jgi:hypothetical protein